MKFEATRDQVLQMMVNAINASKPYGMGVLQYEDREYTVDDLQYSVKPLDLDYYRGRMVKLWIEEDGDDWRMPDVFRPDYQSFAWKYPTPEDLVNSVTRKNADAKVLDYLNLVAGPWKISGNSVVDRNGKILFTPYTPEGVRCAGLIKEAPNILHYLMLTIDNLDGLEKEEANDELEGFLERAPIEVNKKLVMADKMYDFIKGIASDIENSLDMDDPEVVSAYIGKIETQANEILRSIR